MSEYNKYNADYFLEKFQPIIDDLWTVGEYIDKRNERKRCAIGHCFPENEFDFQDDSQEVALIQLFQKHIGRSPMSVNDGKVDDYPQPTPKQRIIAALQDIKKKEDEQ